ncbi:MAG: flavin reductase, partial [Firmicutes bacterium]|nr:flavin reductase [Bacillota bacterium]
MAITLIHGQDHKGSTYNISKTLAEKINGKIDEFFLPKNFNGDCIGCLNCLKNGIENCPHYDELSLILNSMLSSEVIIIDTPTYCM